MITLRDVSKTYEGTPAVSELSLEIASGEKLMILGTSGCGKTTLLKMINRLITPDSGSVRIDDQDIARQPVEQLRRSMGYVMQHNGLFPHYTIEENIAIVPRLLKWDGERIYRRVVQLMEQLHLPPAMLQVFPHELSGGQQQRVGLARALAANPDILLMDEPFGALDNVTRLALQQDFKKLAEFKDKTVVMVTHDVQEAFDLADRICLMNEGKIIQTGTPRELLFRPVSDFVRQFLDSQRLQLTFRSVRIADLLPQLEGSGSEQGIGLNPDHTVWEAMERFQANPGTVCHVMDQNGNLKQFNAESLSIAFNQYQKEQAHE